MIGIPPQQRHKDVPSFVAKVHNSLYTVYATMRAHQRNKEHYKKRPFSPYSVGDLVWLHVSAIKPGRTKKFPSQWKGSYTVIDRTSDVNYKLKLMGSCVKPLIIHHNGLKPCYGTPIHSTSASSAVHSAPLYSDGVRCPSMPPVGSYTTSSVPSDCTS